MVESRPEQQEESPYAKFAYIIDDDELTINSLSAGAEIINCQTRTFSSIEEFLEFLKNSREVILQEWPLVLTDGFEAGFQEIFRALWQNEETKGLPLRLYSGDRFSIQIAERFGISFAAKASDIDIKELFRLPLRVLVIEDSSQEADLIKGHLTKAGWGVKVTPNIEEALTILERDKNFDLISTGGSKEKCLELAEGLQRMDLTIPWVIVNGDRESLQPLAEQRGISFISREAHDSKDIPSLFEGILEDFRAKEQK